MNYILVDTNKKSFLPLTYTRPVSDLRIGIFKIYEKWEKMLGSRVSQLTESYLGGKFPVKFGDKNVFINSKFLPTPLLIEQIEYLELNQKLIAGNDWVAFCSDSQEVNISSSMPSFPADTDIVIENWWDLFKENGKAIESDIRHLEIPNWTQLSPTNLVIGNESDLFIHPTAIAEGVTFNTTNGPIYVAESCTIMEGACIKGPFAMLEMATVKMGAKIYEGTTIGPKCKVGGEIKNSMFSGYSNKSHDGYIGNSVIGEWVNLGANTNNSNLKNTLGTVKVWDYQSKSLVDTQEQFLGCCIGDYSKTSINTSINTGTSIGLNCNVFGTGLTNKFIPNFSWGPDNKVRFNIEKAIDINNKMAYLACESLSEQDHAILGFIHKMG